MVQNFNVDVKFSGPLFSGKAGEIVKRTAKEEALDKVIERWMRKNSRRAGRRNNVLTAHDRQALVAEVSSTLRHPRRSGNAWKNKQLRIARSMLPRILRATERRMAQELGG